MQARETPVDLASALAASAVVGVGIALGAGLGATTVAGLGANLLSSLAHARWSEVKSRWLLSTDGALNHDIQRALARALRQALSDLERRYFTIGEANAMPTEDKESIRAWFREVGEASEDVFLNTISKAASEEEVKAYLYDDASRAEACLLSRVEAAGPLSTYPDHFKSFLRQSLLPQVRFSFGLELKADTRESNRAWRAFQRLLLEGLQDTLESVKSRQEDLYNQVKPKIDEIAIRLAALQEGESWDPGEPFAAGLSAYLRESRGILDHMSTTVDGIATSLEAARVDLAAIRENIDSIAPDHQHDQEPDLPAHLQDIVRRGKDLLNAGRFQEAEEAFRSALDQAESWGHSQATVEAKKNLALLALLFRHDAAGARVLLQSCLDVLDREPNPKRRAEVLEHLARVHDHEGDSEISASLLRQACEIWQGLGDKLGEGATLVSLAWAEGRMGRTSEALELNARAYALIIQSMHEPGGERKADKTEYAQGILANLFLQRAKIHQRHSDLDRAEQELQSALEWQRKLPPNHELAKILTELARVRLSLNQQREGVELLGEAAKILEERGIFSGLSECLRIMGRVEASLGHDELAADFIGRALSAASDGHDMEMAAEALEDLAHLAFERGDLAEARSLLERAGESSKEPEKQAAFLLRVAEIANRQGTNGEREGEVLIERAIALITDAVGAASNEVERAQRLMALGGYLVRAQRPGEALPHFRRAMGCLRDAQDSRGFAEASLAVAEVLDRLGRRAEARETVEDVRRMVDEKPLYDLAAVVDLSLARFAASAGNREEAIRLTESALDLCRKHDLPMLIEALALLDELETARKAQAPCACALPDLIDDLQGQLALCPTNKDGYVRLWAFCRASEFASNLKSALGPNIAIVTAGLPEFIELSERLKPYRDWSLLVTPEEYPDDVYEVIPFSGPMMWPANGVMFLGVKKDEKAGPRAFARAVRSNPELRARLSLAAASTGGAIARYTCVLLDPEAQRSLGAKLGASGWSLALPRVVHEMLQNRDPAELKRDRLFFVYYRRCLLKEGDLLRHDLALLKGLRCMPFYLGTLPESRGVRSLGACTLRLPILSPDAARARRTEIGRVRRALLEVSGATVVTVASKLIELTELCHELGDASAGFEEMTLRCHVLQCEGEGEQQLHVALVDEAGVVHRPSIAGNEPAQ